MSKPNHIQLLEILEKHGLAVMYNITDFMVSHYKKPNSIDNVEWNKQAVSANTLLTDLNYRAFIEIEGGKEEIFTNIRFNIEANKVRWYDNFDVYVSITSIGLDYLDQYYLQQSVLNLNGATEKSLRSQRRLARSTIGVAILAALFSALDYAKPEPKMVELNKSIRLISVKLEKVSRQLDSLQYRLTYPKGKFHK